MSTQNTQSTQAEITRTMLHDGARLTEVVDALDAERLPAKVATGPAPVPTSPEITPDVKRALIDLPKVFGKVIVEERRALTSGEVVSLHSEYKVLKAIGDTLTKRMSVVNENVRSHIDVSLERDGLVDESTDRDSSGHYVVASKGNPTTVHVDGTNENFSLEFRSGRAGTVSISSEALLDLYEAGEISREQYLSLTRETRVFDEHKATDEILKDPSLMDVVRKASRRTGQTANGTSLFVRKVK